MTRLTPAAGVALLLSCCLLPASTPAAAQDLTITNVRIIGPNVTMTFASPVPFLKVYFFGPNGMPSFLPPPGRIENFMSGPWQFTANPSTPIMLLRSASVSQ